MQRLLDLLVNRRFPLAAVMIAAIVAVSWGMKYNSIDGSSRAMLAEDDPYKEEVDQTKLDFPPSTSITFIFEADPDLFSLDALAAIDEMNKRYTEVDGALAAGSLLNYRLNPEDADTYDRDYLIPELDELTPEMLAQIRRIALADEELTESRLASTGDMSLASIKYTIEDTQEARLAVAQSALDLRDSLREKHPNVRIYVLGGVIFEYDSYHASRMDQQQLMPLVLGLSVVLLWYCLKSLSYAICLLLVAAPAITMSMGSFGWLDVPFNQISALGPLVVMVVAIADGIHIVSIYAQNLHKGLAKLDAMRESLRVNIQPVTLATLTTAMGFLSLNYCSSPGIYGFGNIVAIGVIWAFFITLLLLPALILALPTNKVPKPLGVQGFIVNVNRLVQTHGNKLFWGGTALILITLALLPLNKLDFNRFNFIDEDSDLHHVITALTEKIGNDRSLVYNVRSGEYYGITQPEFLNQIDTFTTWAESQPDVSFVASYSDYLRARNKSEHDDDEAYDQIPTDQLQVIDYLVGYQLIQEIEPSLEPIFNADYSSIRMVIGTSGLSNLEILQLSQRIDAWLADNLAAEVEVLHGNNEILYARLDRAIAVELMQGFTLSFILITATMIVGLRSMRYGLLSIMPNLFPATIVFGFWGLFIGELSPYILMMFSISIGLVVDDSVHVLSKYITARREGQTPENSVSYSLEKAGSAITITTASLAIGTFVLILSNTFHFQNVALLLTPIIIVALLLDILFLPPLLTKFDHWVEQRRGQTAAA